MSANPMQAAIDSAIEGVTAGDGGPFGASIVKDSQIIAVAHNTVLVDVDPTCHAEINAVRLAAKALNTHDLSGCLLYTTAEPCPMCLAASYWAQIDVIQFGVPRAWVSDFGFNDDPMYTELQLPYQQRKIKTTGMVQQEACADVFKLWQSKNGQLY